MAFDAMSGEPIEIDPALNALATRVLDAAFAVHRALGPGHLESVYELAMCAELAAQSIPYVRQVEHEIVYRGQVVGTYRTDLLIADRLIVELKAVDQLAEIHRAQLIAYLRATGITLGYLINFNVALLKDGIRRIVLTRRR
jgi:GxxExxY protein